MPERGTKVVGFFAYWSPTQVVCVETDACLIAGSSAAMARYLAKHDPLRAPKATVKKTRLGEIASGLQLGAAYAFDKESYARFHPLALEAGLPVAAADFEEKSRQGGWFFTVRPVLS